MCDVKEKKNSSVRSPLAGTRVPVLMFAVNKTISIRTPSLAALSLLTAAPSAQAHEGSHGWWTLDPWVVLPLLLFAAAYVFAVAKAYSSDSRPQRLRAMRPPALLACAGALGALFLALIWPLDALGELSFAAHMTQHMMLIAVAAPLLVFAEPGVALTRTFPTATAPMRALRRSRLLRVALKPRTAFAVHAAVIWGWHAPGLFELALRNDLVHVLGHLSFFGSALLFWTSLRQAGRAGGDGYGIAALGTLGTLMHMGLLGGLLTFAPHPLYSTYDETALATLAAITPLEDQQLAGLVMWVPAAIPYLIAGLGFVLAWLRDAQRHAARADSP